MYPDVSLHINGQWTQGAEGRSEPILNPATGEKIGTLAHATKPDLDMALKASEDGFKTWRKVSPYDRYQTLRKAANIIRSRADDIGKIMTQEQGKPFVEAKGETLLAGDIMDWFAEEARRTYGRVVPARQENVYQLVVKEPVGPVAAFTPWNFPINQAVRKC
jgi:succinate-semialdehyde dehydrogenase/glutarate-semialdehyde dehydrogenase